MLLTRLERREAIDAWPYLYRILLPALKRDPERTPGRLFDDLVEGRAGAWVAHDFPGHGVVVAEGNGSVLWITYTAGKAAGCLRDGMALLEDAARANGFTEIRLKGRKGWKRMFPDFEVVTDGFPVELRKVLA